MTTIGQDFYARSTLTVARLLLGQRLVRQIDGRRLSGRIVETEAYVGPQDSANHASKGRTLRTEVMFGPPGRTYVYLIYGIYAMLNLVTEREGFPAAVLIRAVEPLEGQEIMRANRPVQQPVRLTNGPGKLCQALGIDKNLHNWDVTRGEQLWLEPAESSLPEEAIAAGPRTGIDYAQPDDRRAQWRFWVRGSRFVSR